MVSTEHPDDAAVNPQYRFASAVTSIGAWPANLIMCDAYHHFGSRVNQCAGTPNLRAARLMLWALLCSLPIEGIRGCVAVAEPGKEGGESLLKFAVRVQ